MVKFVASGQDKILIGIGLEDENIWRLQHGESIVVKLSDLGFTGPLEKVEILLIAGTDAQTVGQQLAPLLGPDTIVHSAP